MKVIFFSRQFLPMIGGLENVVRDWAHGLSDANHQVQVITTTRSETDDHFPFKVHRNIGQFKVWRLMRDSDVIVIFNISLKSLLPCILAFRPIVISHQSTNFDLQGNLNRYGGIKQFVSDYFPVANIACSSYVARFLKKNPIIIHNPYNSTLFKLKPEVDRNGDLVFLGRLVSDKGCDVLIKALGILKAKYFINPQVTIIGNGPELDFLKTLSRKEAVDNQIDFVGSKSGHDLVNHLNAHKILVVPSIWEEPFGIVALEGLACGCKVLVSNSGGLPEAVGDCGRVIGRSDPDELALTIKESLNERLESPDHDKVLLHLSNFTVTSTVDRLINVLKAATV